MKIPKQLKAYGFIYPIIQKNNLRDKWGKWDGLINHRKKKDNVRKKRNSFL